MKTTLELITPDLAMKFLEKNKLNRKLTDRHINFLAQQMRENKWLDTGDTIKFDEGGNLLDGQHRLNAIAKSGKSFEILVVRGLNKKAFEVMDTGKSRSAGDVLSSLGNTNASTLASAVKSILQYNAGKYSDALNNKTGNAVTNSKVLAFVNKHEDLGEIITYCYKIYTRYRFIKPTTLVLLYWIFQEKSVTDTDKFFEQLSLGLDLKEESPIRILRERLIKESQNKRKLPERDRLALCIIAWNHFRSKKTVKILQFNSKMEFPKPI